VIFLVLVSLWGCKTSSDIVDPTPPPPPPPPPPLQEQLIGKMFYADRAANLTYDIFTADLYIVPKTTTATSKTQESGEFEDTLANAQHTHRTDIAEESIHLKPDRGTLVRQGIHKYRHIQFKDRILDRAVIRTAATIDISLYDFAVRNVSNMTNSNVDDFAVNVNHNNQIVFVTAPDGLDVDRSNTEIVIMDITDRVRRPLTPISGRYSGNNWDPDWKNDYTIVWSHNNQFMEVNIQTLQVSGSLLPEITTPLYDPVYSPDGTKILFNTWIGSKKNSFLKNLVTGLIEPVLPADYYAVHQDDNPTWVFSNTRIVGHIFMDGRGRLYTRDFTSGSFLIITDNSRDFRYVRPILVSSTLYFIFSDWTDKNHVALWIANENGNYLRELNQTGDEIVFLSLGFAPPQTDAEMDTITRLYLGQFHF